MEAWTPFSHIPPPPHALPPPHPNTCAPHSGFTRRSLGCGARVGAQAPAGWSGETGFVTAAMVERVLPAPADDAMVFVCGPPPMMKAVCGGKGPKGSQGELDGVLKHRGFDSAGVFKF